jgi:hypothetical protein
MTEEKSALRFVVECGVMIVLAGLVVVGLNAFAVYTEDKYNENPEFGAIAKYSNLTTISVRFYQNDFVIGNFTTAINKIDIVDIRIDGVLVETIHGYNLSKEPYYYPVDTTRHTVDVKIVYKSGLTSEHVFSNSRLEAWST